MYLHASFIVFHILYLKHWPWFTVLIQGENLLWLNLMLFPAFLAIVVDAVIFSFFKACRIQISERKEKGGGGGEGSR